MFSKNQSPENGYKVRGDLFARNPVFVPVSRGRPFSKKSCNTHLLYIFVQNLFQLINHFLILQAEFNFYTA